jgi:hypothetical protein
LPDFRRAALFHEGQDFAGVVLDGGVARVLDDLATTNEVVENSSQYRPPSRGSPEGALEKILCVKRQCIVTGRVLPFMNVRRFVLQFKICGFMHAAFSLRQRAPQKVSVKAQGFY